MRSLFDRVARIAGRQHGRISAKQLRAAGVDRHRVKRWRADGRLRPVGAGVYAVGHEAPSLLADYMAAVLVCGEGAVLSHRAAAHVLGLVRGGAPSPEVTVPTTAGRRADGVRLHRVRAIHRLDWAVHHDIPVTIVPRILVDLAPSTTPDELARMCHEAWIRHRTTPHQIEACIARNPRKHAIRKLRAAMGADVLLSELERAFVRLLERHDLPLPRTNVDHEGDKVDCHWPLLGVTVELLSYRFHASRHAFEQDVARRRRSNHVAYTYGDVFERPQATIEDLRPRLTT
jgi:hypothetical protein